MLEVTAKVISFLTVYYVLLAAKVIRLRFQHKVSLGDGSLQFIIGTVLPAILKGIRLNEYKITINCMFRE